MSHVKTRAMLNPKMLMAHVLTFISLIVQAQSSSDNSILCYIGADNGPHKINTYITQEKPYVITCKYEDGTAAVPKFLQFTCSEGSSLVTIQVNITDGVHTQVITRDVQVNESDGLLEMPVLAFMNDAMAQSGKARIKSITFNNSMNIPLLLSEVNFSNISANYEIKMNQVFTVDLNSNFGKNYFMYATTSKTVSINLYKTNGELEQKILKTLVKGNNFIRFPENQMTEDKYVIVISEYDIKKAPNSRITVMN
ncbi:MAG: hypothetical protein JWN78_1355 [Bacteroidota bacterium]|nr:hypothetical protein [Bacteroidota bacterium]